jgi:hypothetical protein
MNSFEFIPVNPVNPVKKKPVFDLVACAGLSKTAKHAMLSPFHHHLELS